MNGVRPQQWHQPHDSRSPLHCQRPSLEQHSFLGLALGISTRVELDHPGLDRRELIIEQHRLNAAPL